MVKGCNFRHLYTKENESGSNLMNFTAYDDNPFASLSCKNQFCNLKPNENYFYHCFLIASLNCFFFIFYWVSLILVLLGLSVAFNGLSSFYEHLPSRTDLFANLLLTMGPDLL